MGDNLQTLNEIDEIEIARSTECDCSEISKHISVSKNDLTIVSQNIRSVYCNFDDFSLLLSSFKFQTDVIILTECRLNDNKPIPKLNNYHCFTTTRHLNQNDGVVAYVKDTLKPKVKEINLAQASCLQLDILNNHILCIYRSPSNTNTDSFIDSLSTHLDTITSQKNIIIAGDININIRIKDTETSQESNNRVNYLNMLSLHGILPGHTLPTRERNCLDHFMIKINKKKISAFIAILHTTVTDHYTTFMSLRKQKCTQVAKKTTTSINFEQALKKIHEQNLAELLFCDDPSLLTEILIDKLTESINLSTTTVNIPNSKRIIKPWVTPGILRCIKNRNKLQKTYKSDPHNEINKITYNRYRNHCNKLIKKLKRKYDRELLAKSKSNNKLLWKNIKNITYTNKSKSQNIELINIKSTPIESANFINNYFVNIGKQLAQQIQTSVNNNPNYVPNQQPTQANSFVLFDTDLNEVDGILMSLKSDSAAGWDNISTGFLKYIRKEVVPIITHLANLCFRDGIFPAPLKKSIITPVHKGGDRDDLNNYRPISVLPAISKLLEKLINIRLLKYFNKYKTLSPTQFGFRQNISAEDAVTALSSLVANQLDNRNKCLTVFLDLKKAFDTVSVPILVNKLEMVGIRGTSLNLLKDYLSNRKQRVKLGQYVSDDAEVSYGVPQGSVLGPTLFLAYINDLCNMTIDNAKVFSYADDTAVVFSGRSWDDVEQSASCGMAQIAKWLNNNLLTLNTSKTNYICFSICNRTQPNKDLTIKVHKCGDIINKNCVCPTINKVTHTKYLGVMLDQRLSWYPHLEQVTNRVRKLSWIFKTLRHIVPKNDTNTGDPAKNLLKDIYIALVQSVLVYCIPIWGGAAKTKFIAVERVQRALIKIMFFKRIRFPTERLYQISDLLSVRKLYIVHTVLKKHKRQPYDTAILSKRRKDIIAPIPQTNTRFCSRQYEKRSSQLYNKINKEIYVYTKQYYECKKLLIQWIKPLTYEDTEAILQHTS